VNFAAEKNNDLKEMPGHLIRRLQQIAVAIFLEDMEEFSITPVQYAVLSTLRGMHSIDQRSLAAEVGVDTSTLGGVVDRLESRGCISRQSSSEDRRVKQLVLTTVGAELLRKIEPAIRHSQNRILAPLSEKKQVQFLALLSELVEKNNALSRAPLPTQSKS
jgi:DNA-binding MarR family transcriptional regulator